MCTVIGYDGNVCSILCYVVGSGGFNCPQRRANFLHLLFFGTTDAAAHKIFLPAATDQPLTTLNLDELPEVIQPAHREPHCPSSTRCPGKR